MKRLLSIAILSSALIGTPALAEEELDNDLHGEISASVIVVNGNSNSKQYSGYTNIEKDGQKVRHTGKLTGSNKTSYVDSTATSPGKNERTEEKYFFAGQTDFKLDSSNFLFALLEYEEDKFSGFDYQGGFTIGYGRQMFKSEQTSWRLEGGPGYRRSNKESVLNIDYTPLSAIPPGPAVLVPPFEDTPAEDEAIFRLASKFKTMLKENTEFSNEVSSVIGEHYTITRSDTALTTNIIGSLYLKLLNTIKRQSSDIANNAHNSDIETTVNITYKF